MWKKNKNDYERLLKTKNMHSYQNRMSFIELHKVNNKGTQTQMCNYKHTMIFYKLINIEIPKLDWIDF